MDWNDEYDNMDYSPHGEETIPDKSTEDGIDPMYIANPVSAYFLLSDDAQDEISGSDKKTMKCLSCELLFRGEIYDRGPGCFSLDTEEEVNEKEHEYW